jgi:hypothetical protein
MIHCIVQYSLTKSSRPWDGTKYNNTMVLLKPDKNGSGRYIRHAVNIGARTCGIDWVNEHGGWLTPFKLEFIY